MYVVSFGSEPRDYKVDEGETHCGPGFARLSILLPLSLWRVGHTSFVLEIW